MDGPDLLESFGEFMREARDRGLPFDLAWQDGLRELTGDGPTRPDGRWATGMAFDALNATRGCWARAYIGRPARSGERAAAHLAYLLAEPERVDDERHRALVA
jgi:hypothetical protein